MRPHCSFITNPIPVILITGFLGSGKTTLLLRLLKKAIQQTLQPAVFMNEMGRIDVDGAILLEEFPSLKLKKWVDGCMCCSQRHKVERGILDLLEQKPDLLILELSGVADPAQIHKLLAMPSLKYRVELNHVLTVIDAEHFLDYNSSFASDRELIHTLHQQVRTATHLIVNKTDVTELSMLPQMYRALSRINPSAQISACVACDINLDSFLHSSAFPVCYPEQIHEPAVPYTDGQPNTNLRILTHPDPKVIVYPHASSLFSYLELMSITVKLSPHPLNPTRLEQTLIHMGSSLIRVKGYVKSSDGYLYLFQGSGERFVWRPTLLSTHPYLVFIGLELDREYIEHEIFHPV